MIPSILDHLSAVLLNWQMNTEGVVDRVSPAEDPYWAVSSYLNPGHCYFYLLKLPDVAVEYVHPEVKEVLGCDPADFSTAHLLGILHPDDVESKALKQAAALDGLQNRIPGEKIFQYKACYSFRVQDGNGGWKHILQQYIPVGQAPDGGLNRLFCLHTDVSCLGLSPGSHVAFIGLQGEPSFQLPGVQSVDLPESLPDISEREKAIVLLLAEGLSSKQIAERLGIAKNTVDTHRRNLLRKTGAKNTLELAIRLVREGRGDRNTYK
jgi:DNA-binding CsgD family transcriptional regulator